MEYQIINRPETNLPPQVQELQDIIFVGNYKALVSIICELHSFIAIGHLQTWYKNNCELAIKY